MRRFTFPRALGLVTASFLLADTGRAASTIGFYDLSALYAFACSADGLGSGALSDLSPGCAAIVDEGSFSVSGSGEATYDTVRATARVGLSSVESVYLNGSGSAARAEGTARYEDMVTLDVPGRTGEVVDLVFTAALSGSVSAGTDPAYAFARSSGGLRITVNGEDLIISTEAKSEGEEFSIDQNPGLVQITLGTPFEVMADLGVTAQILERARAPAGVGLSGSASAEFGGSGGITSFQLFELGGEAISDFDLSSESGAFGFYQVPEPGEGVLAAMALGALGAVRRRGRARSARPARP